MSRQKGFFSRFHNELNKIKSNGQVAVIVTVIIAIIIFFILIFVNIAQVGALKLYTSQVTDKAALNLASMFGSIAYKLTWDFLGGDDNDNGTKTTNDVWAIAGIIGGTILSIVGILLIWIPGVGAGIAFTGFMLLCGGLAATQLGVVKGMESAAKNAALAEAYKFMDQRDALRELALRETVSTLHTDTVLYKRLEPGQPHYDPARSYEYFEDRNNNGQCDLVREPFVSAGGQYNNDMYDPPESFTDLNGNQTWDAFEPYVDTDGNGAYFPGEAFTDVNGNGRYDRGERIVNLDPDLDNAPADGIPDQPYTSEYIKLPAITRFEVWYLNDRVPIVAEGLEHVDEVIKAFLGDPGDPTATPPVDPVVGIDRWIKLIPSEMDSNTWEYQAAHFVIDGSGLRTCDPTTGSCPPDWYNYTTYNDANGVPQVIDGVEIVRITEANVGSTPGDEATPYSGDLGVYYPEGFLGFIPPGMSADGELSSFLSQLSACNPAWTTNFNCPSRGARENLPCLTSLGFELANLTALIKQLKEQPRSQMIGAVRMWCNLLYDIAWSDGTHGVGDDNWSHDVFDRLTYWEIQLEATVAVEGFDGWIAQLEAIDMALRADIASVRGACPMGGGNPLATTCFSVYAADPVGPPVCPECFCCPVSDCPACGIPCGAPCCWSSTRRSPCAWEGAYYTCCQNPQVCITGDLFGTVPAWCLSRDSRITCAPGTNCTSCSDDDFDGVFDKCACDTVNCVCQYTATGLPAEGYDCGTCTQDFQGQLSWDNPLDAINEGLTEVGQVIEILRRLADAIHDVRHKIQTFAYALKDIYERMDVCDTASSSYDAAECEKENRIRNRLTYAWNDENYQAHFAEARIYHYPEAVPSPRVRPSWGGLRNQRIIDHRKDNFVFETKVYHPDQPTPLWNTRRRRNPDQPAFAPGLARIMARDIVKRYGRFWPQEIFGMSIYTNADIDNLYDNFMITNAARVCYGPRPEHIYIDSTEQDPGFTYDDKLPETHMVPPQEDSNHPLE